MFNEPISPPSSTPSSPPYYTISSDSKPSDPQSPTLAQLQAHALSIYHHFEPEANIPSPSEQPPTPPSEPPIVTSSENPIIHNSEPSAETTPTPPTPTFPTPEPEPNFPTLEEAITLFVESSTKKIRSLSENFGISDNPSAVRIHWNKRSWREAAGMSGQRGKREEEEEKAHLEEEQRDREVAEKAAAAAAEAEAKAKADAEEAAHIAAEEAAKARNDALTQGEQSHSDFAPLVLKTLEYL
ncbi:uncharacterized protein LOC127080886 [Lathyrus oleraceus]|uniref:uncharacterized protein LOC127080886 n=1 Tax=Pisum sativum TaxID=3888 RepID=UPI0021D3A467|nr:uncharacterized protein LOC127080886 [Pisum sativum]